MGVSITPQITMTAVRTLDLAAAAAVNIQQSGFNYSTPKFSDTSTPAVTKESYQTYALVAGTKTIDLTALLDAANVAQDCTGLKVQTILIKNPAGNHQITIAPAVGNPYPLFGTGNSLVLPGHATVDCTVGMVVPEGLPDVAAGVKNITITGTGTESFSIGFTLG